jgi:oxygen-independent coproporphyrinogen-3 oxidase
VSEFESRTGLDWATVATRVELAEANGLMCAGSGGRWAPTPLGRRFLNDLQALFLPDPAKESGTSDRQSLATPG